MTLTAPFPYYGGKRRLSGRIWQRLGNPRVYAEPFAGSLACLLARPDGAGPREIVCDLDGGIANFWRATIADPDAVAYWADWPTIHQDLTARHTWLIGWLSEHREQLTQDPTFCDAQAAGWWVWGISLWIGGGWCHTDSDSRPHVDARAGGQGVSAQRPYVADRVGGRGVSAQRADDSRPLVDHRGGGSGVSAQRVSAQIPYVTSSPGGRGVMAQRTTRPDLIEWFTALRHRLAAVVVLNRSWESALTPTLLQDTHSNHGEPDVGVLLDPPYITTDRSHTLYGSDLAGLSDDAAAASWAWALEHGDRYKIAYCCHEGDIDAPPGWHVVTETLGGITKLARRHRRDMVLFSPVCEDRQQPKLW